MRGAARAAACSSSPGLRRREGPLNSLQHEISLWRICILRSGRSARQIEGNTMDINYNRTKDLIELIVCVLIIVGAIDRVARSDHAILANKQPPHLLSNSYLLQGQFFDQDEVRISRLFAEDTLPRLMQCGLVRKYELTQSRTLLFVNGRMWKGTSKFFKSCLLTEIAVHNKTNGLAPETMVLDDRSRRLFAKISASDAVAFFD